MFFSPRTNRCPRVTPPPPSVSSSATLFAISVSNELCYIFILVFGGGRTQSGSELAWKASHKNSHNDVGSSLASPSSYASRTAKPPQSPVVTFADRNPWLKSPRSVATIGFDADAARAILSQSSQDSLLSSPLESPSPAKVKRQQPTPSESSGAVPPRMGDNSTAPPAGVGYEPFSARSLASYASVCGSATSINSDVEICNISERMFTNRQDSSKEDISKQDISIPAEDGPDGVRLEENVEGGVSTLGGYDPFNQPSGLPLSSFHFSSPPSPPPPSSSSPPLRGATDSGLERSVSSLSMTPKIACFSVSKNTAALVEKGRPAVPQTWPATNRGVAREVKKAADGHGKEGNGNMNAGVHPRYESFTPAGTPGKIKKLALKVLKS